MNPHRRRPKEPREERQFLQVVSKAIRHDDGRSVGARQWVTNLQITLAVSDDLSSSAPQRCRDVAERIVHPFIDFMSEDGGVGNGWTKQASGVEFTRRVRLNREPGGAVVAENAACIQVGDGGRHHGAVEEEDGEVGGIDAGRTGNNLGRHNKVKVVDVNNPQGAARREVGERQRGPESCGNSQHDGIQRLHRTDQRVVGAARPVLTQRTPEVPPLKSITVFRCGNDGPAEVERGRVE